MTDYTRMDLTGETPQIDGAPGPVPRRHRGLRDSHLADLSWSNEADLIDVGYWRVVDATLPALGLGQMLGDPVLTIDVESSTVVRSRATIAAPEGPLRAAWAAERDRLGDGVKAAAEAARLRWLTPGSGKALTYEAKRAEAVRWVADSSPRDLSTYPFALREAAALGGGDPSNAAHLADIDEAAVGAVIAVYAARAAAHTVIGSTIEAREQAAVALVETHHDAAIAAWEGAATADLSSHEAAMRAATEVMWPAP